MVLKKIAQSVLSPLGLELHRTPDPTLPMLHEFLMDGEQSRFWITNPFTKQWWFKPEIAMNGELKELKKLCAPSDTVLEIGSHHGMLTLLMSRWVGEKGHVFAIEASSENALTLDANCFENRLRNVSTAHVAIGRTEGVVRFGGESLAAKSGVVREVRMVTADQFCESKGIVKPNVLKIDVEGFEMDVLAGARKLLESRPKLALELHVDLLAEAGSSAREVWDFLDEAGMFSDRTITMLSRPAWDRTKVVASFEDLPRSGVVNLFVSERQSSSA